MGGLDRARTRLSRLVHWFHEAPRATRIEVRPQLRWRSVLPVALLGMVFAVVLIGDRMGVPHEFDPTRPFTVGREWGLIEALAEQRGAEITPTGGTYGYDGQWFLGLAYDPLLRTDITDTFDAPQYRAQRPLLGMLGWLLAAGQPGAIPFALLVVEVLAVGLGCAALARLATAYGRSRWWGFAFLLIPGVLVGVLYGTAEPLGLALVATGLTLAHDRRLLWAGVAFAGAGLTKETYLGFAAAVAVWIAVRAILRGAAWWRPALSVTLPGVVAFGAWWLYVSVAMPASARAPEQVFAAPFHGWWATFVSIARGEYRVDYHDHAIGWAGEGIMVVTFVVIMAALAAGLWYRQSMLAYSVFIWCPHGLVIVDFLLGRFLSAQRALAPTMLAALLMLLAVPWTRRGAASDGTRPHRLPRQRSGPPELSAVREPSGAAGAVVD